MYYKSETSVNYSFVIIIIQKMFNIHLLKIFCTTLFINTKNNINKI